MEIVLPSGRFASVRRIKWWDRVMCHSDSKGNIDVYVMALAIRCVTIDGEPLSIEQAKDMDIEEANPLIEAICGQLIAAGKSKGIA